MKIGILFLGITALLISNNASAWTVSADFESGTIGANATGPSGFHSAGTSSGANGSTVTFAADPVNANKKSAKMFMTRGDGGTYGQLYYPAVVREGAEVWARAYYYFASPWSWANLSGQLAVIKLLRGVAFNDGAGNYLSVFGDSNARIQLSNEPGPAQSYTSPATFDMDKWQCIEMYAKLSASSGIMRIWKNGTLIHQDTSTKTMGSATDYANFAYFMSNWNEGVTQNQTMYMDNIIITTDRPSMTDSQGNPMIGPVSTGKKPSAPTNVQVK